MPSYSGIFGPMNGYQTLDASLNDSVTFTPTSAVYTVEYPAGTIAINGSSTTQTLALTAGGQFRVFVKSGSVAFAVTDAADEPQLTPAQVTATQALVSGERIIELSLASGAADANAATLQAIVTGGGVFRILTPGTYELAQVQLSSDTYIELGKGVLIKKKALLYSPLFINTEALKVAPGRNSNIFIFGDGGIDGNYSANNSSTLVSVAGSVRGDAQFGIQGEIAMIQVDNCGVLLGSMVNCSGFCIQWQGVKGQFSVLSVETPRDFLHINGPSSRVKIDRCYGFSGDDFIALNAWDWERSGVRVGDITDVAITNVAYLGANHGSFTGSLVRFLSGTRATGYGQAFGAVRKVHVNGYRADPTQGSVTAAGYAFQFPADYDPQQATYAGTAEVSGVVVENGTVIVPNANYQAVAIIKTAGSADGQANLTVSDVTFRNGHFDCSSGTSTSPIKVGVAYTTCSINGLNFDDMQWSPRNGTSNTQAFVTVTHKTPIDSIGVRGLTLNGSTSTGSIAAAAVAVYSSGNASTVKAFEVSRLRTATGTTTPAAWVLVNGGIVNLLTADRLTLTGLGAAGGDTAGINVSEATGRLDKAVVTNSVFTSVKNLISTTSSASAGPTTVTFRGCVATNCNHPVILNTGTTVTALFEDCAIEAVTNLARVNNASAALTLGLRDTTSSGAGAATITVVTGTARVRASDRIAVSPAFVQTPGDGDEVFFSGTPAYSGVNVISGTGAGRYVYRGTGTVGWIKVN